MQPDNQLQPENPTPLPPVDSPAAAPVPPATTDQAAPQLAATPDSATPEPAPQPATTFTPSQAPQPAAQVFDPATSPQPPAPSESIANPSPAAAPQIPTAGGVGSQPPTVFGGGMPAATGNSPGFGPAHKANVNPFKHLWHGSKNFFATNTIPALVTILCTIALYVVFSFGAVLLLGHMFSGATFGSLGASIAKSLVMFFGLLIVFMLINGYFSLAFVRAVLTGSRHQAVSVGEVFRVASKRYGLSLLTFLLLFAAVAGFGILAAVIGGMLAPVGIIMGIIGVVGIIIAALRFQYVLMAIVDDDKPSGVRDALSRSTAVWKKSRLASVVYWVTLIVLMLVISFATGNSSMSSSSNSSTYNTYPAASAMPASGAVSGVALTGTVIVGILVYALVSTAINAIVLGGLADIYNEVRDDRNTAISESPLPPSAASSAAAPQAPSMG